MALTAQQIAEQRKQAEELLFSGPQTLGFAKGLFFGHFNAPLLFPYPELKPRGARRRSTRRWPRCAASPTRSIDAAAIDRNADIPAEVIDGLAELGVLGMTAPTEYGGRGFSQLGYCQHHGSDRRPLRLRRRSSSTPTTASASAPCCCSARRSRNAAGCRDLVSGRKLAAFALTEPEAGSDAANVQTTADAQRRTARPTSSTARSATSPTAASPRC